MLAGPDPYGTVNPGAAIWVRGAPGRYLVAALSAAVSSAGRRVPLREAPIIDLVATSGRITGVVCRTADGGTTEIEAGAVVLGCGGFEASARLRAAYLGPQWDAVRVRGTRYNTGDLLGALERVGAQMTAGWSDCHATPVSDRAPFFGNDHENAENFARHDYSYGLMLNAEGQRFFDEGENFRLYTYAKAGRAILGQPGGKAFQIFDQNVTERLDFRYHTESTLQADNLAALAALIDVDAGVVASVVDNFNELTAGNVVDFTSLDGARYPGMVQKSNWAQPLNSPPFEVFPVACGITFTYGGVRTDLDSRVMDGRDRAIPGLFAVGEIQGGLFLHQYAGGSGLMRGAVFGRIAGTCAAVEAAHV